QSGRITGSAAIAGTFQSTVTVSDGKGLSDQIVINWTFSSQDPTNQLVQISDIADQSNQVGDAANLQINASDPDGGAVTFTAQNLPDGLSLNSASGLISGTFTNTGIFDVSIMVEDDENSQATATFRWTVNNLDPTNQLVQIASIADQSSLLGSQVNLKLDASDPDGGSITYAAQNLPDGLSLGANSGLITGTATKTGSFNVTITVTDDENSQATMTFEWTIFELANLQYSIYLPSIR
ncbi:MAG: Ig domain-containing protein, partial [Chloroflexota bacterium]